MCKLCQRILGLEPYDGRTWLDVAFALNTPFTQIAELLDMEENEAMYLVLIDEREKKTA